MQELIHASAPAGLLEGRPGYTTVAATESLPQDLARMLEHGSTAAITRLGKGVDPERFAIYRLWTVGTARLAVTRIVPVAADYTGRPARLAHHFVLEAEEVSGSTIAAILMDRTLFVNRWEGDPQRLKNRVPPADPTASAPAAGCPGLTSVTDHGESWERALATEGCRTRASPVAVLVPSECDMRAVLASIARRCEDPRRLSIETSLDHLMDARPSLLVLRDRTIPTTGMQLLADWSTARGAAAPPAVAAAPKRRSASFPHHGPELQIGELPEPTAVQRAAPSPPAPAASPAPVLDEAHVREQQRAWRFPLAAALWFAGGVVTGAAATLLIHRP